MPPPIFQGGKRGKTITERKKMTKDEITKTKKIIRNISKILRGGIWNRRENKEKERWREQEKQDKNKRLPA